MLIDLHAGCPGDLRISDVCIVGAGAAGLTLARQLLEQGYTVTLLESGGLDFEQETQDLYRGENVGLPYYDLDQARLRFFGGTVSIWGGRCAMMNPIDFERRDWVKHSGWPVRYQDMLPYYQRANAAFDLGPMHYAEDGWDELGRSGPGFADEKIATSFWRFDEMTERFTAGMNRDLLMHPDLDVLLHANVVGLQAGKKADRIDCLRVATLRGLTCKVRAKQYVLACGAIENARMLLVSNDVEPAGIGNAHDQVGRYFMEHPYGRLGKVKTQNPVKLWAAFQKRFQRSGPPLAPALRMSDAQQAEHKALNCSVTFKLQRDPGKGVAVGNRLYHQIKHTLSPDAKGRFLNRTYRRMRAWFHRGIRETVEKLRVRAGMTDLYVMVRGEQAPNPDSRVMLSAERDAFGVPRVQLDWLLSEQDKDTVRAMARTLDAEFRRLGIGEVEPCEWLDQPGTAWPVDPTVGNHPIAGYHHMGGTRMSDDPAQGVVDANCRVHNYANLYIAGSSVFPTSGWANPTLTIVALTLRLADHLHGMLSAEARANAPARAPVGSTPMATEKKAPGYAGA
ncbi:putative oxidoreductase [Caenibius tardaugens NBRC 16725]|uniref:Putative oxidoreductase n=1 Tax=Caenibius tardaugens NBRC 16725 TaxID=1219035 RepID=U2Y818_9SPHN|nr:GMC family oxidoreductase [Caenibius tardaugens]AZI36671.1 GMC family oxidoreductase [Caenibius tardaugens NBRC 16725]GAD49331.1 putative oxidoreductase [Caenibius tardaugens NBRC 16725]